MSCRSGAAHGERIPLLLDQAEHFVEVDALEGVDVVVQVGADRAFGVEEAHGRSLSRVFGDVDTRALPVETHRQACFTPTLD